MNYKTCGEISCEECNDRYEKALARIAELEQMVRELVEAVDQCFGNVAISMDDEIVWANTRRKALALLQPEKRR